jgi:SAM-dependent methyltransferase
MDGATEDDWSGVAREWSALWGQFSDPARRALISPSGIGPGSRVLDVGCGSGEFLSMLQGLGTVTAGIDPAPGMLELARRNNPQSDIRLGAVESLPWPDRSFDFVTAVNALQFADDTLVALAEMTRVTTPGGTVAVANWAEGELNDLHAIETAVAAAIDDEVAPDGDLRSAGGLEALFRDGGLDLVAAGLVDVPWEVPDDETLVAGVLLGENADVVAELSGAVIASARPFLTRSGGYRLVNRFRFAAGRVPVESGDGSAVRTGG